MSELKDRLLAAMDHRKRVASVGESITQTALAAACKISKPSVSDWFTGKTKSLEGSNLIAAARFLRVNPRWLSSGDGQMLDAARAGHEEAAPVEATPYLPGFEALSVPLLATTASMGPGVEQHDDVMIGRLTLDPGWVTRTFKAPSKPDNLRFIHGYGDSMWPTFSDGDVLLVDTGVPAVDVDGIYVLETNNRLYIKRVRQRIDGAYEISSDNPTVKTVDVLNGSQEVVVKGRVVWVWNGKKL